MQADPDEGTAEEDSFNLLHVVLEECKGQLLEHISRVEQEKVLALRNGFFSMQVRRKPV